MQKILGLIIILGCVFGGYFVEGGQLVAIWQPAEIMIIIGAGIGSMIIANPLHVLREIAHQIKGVISKKKLGAEFQRQLLMCLYELLEMVQTGGLRMLDQHIEQPDESTIFQKFPLVLKQKRLVMFIADNFRLMAMGKIDAHELEGILDQELETIEEELLTGAVNAVAGKFEMANNGTLLLDEIGDMTLALQAKLLRVLQERQVERLGSHRAIKLNFRLIASTNKNLEAEVAAGRFREDLFYRVSVVPITVPALRERPEDILPLAESFIKKYAHTIGKNISLSETAKAALMKYPWPGNVRQLENVMQRGMILNQDGIIHASALGLPFAPSVESVGCAAAPSLHQPASTSREDLQRHGRVAQYHYIADLMRKYQGNRTQIADCLGITPRALRYRLASMRKHGIEITF